MLAVLLTTMMLSQVASPVPATREWKDSDPGVRFAEGTTAPPIEPVAGWRGRAEISVRCMVETDGALSDCEVVREFPPGALKLRSARVAVGRMRLLMDQSGPAPGDAFTIDVVVVSNWIPRR